MAVTVDGLPPVKDLAMSSFAKPAPGTLAYHSKAFCALSEIGEAYCWGSKILSIDSDQLIAPEKVDGLSNIIDIAMPAVAVGSDGLSPLLALDDTGTLYQWDGQTITTVASGVKALGGDADCFINADSIVECINFETGNTRLISGTEDAVVIGDRCVHRAGGEISCWKKTDSVATHLTYYNTTQFTGITELKNGCLLYDTGATKCFAFEEDTGRPHFSGNNGTRSYVLGGLTGITQLAENSDDDLSCGLNTDGNVTTNTKHGHQIGNNYNHVGQLGSGLQIGEQLINSKVFKVEAGLKPGSIKFLSHHTDNMCAILMMVRLNVGGTMATLPSLKRQHTAVAIWNRPNHGTIRSILAYSRRRHT